MARRYQRGNQKPYIEEEQTTQWLGCLFFNIRILITSLVSFGNCVVCSSIYGFWLPLWYLLAIVLSVLQYTDSDYLFGICCKIDFLKVSSNYNFQENDTKEEFGNTQEVIRIRILKKNRQHNGQKIPKRSVLLQYTDSDYLFGIFWPLGCLFFNIRILITSLVSVGHCVVCSSIYGFWLPLWYLLAIVLSVLLQYTDSDYLLGISKQLPKDAKEVIRIRILKNRQPNDQKIPKR
jgi:hypothetical protein